MSSSRFLKNLSSLVNGNADRQPRRDAGEPDAGPSTITTPLFPLSGTESDTPSEPQGPPKAARKAVTSRALNAVVRATTQVALPTHVEAAAPPRHHRTGRHTGVLLTETEKVRLQIMQVQLKLTGLGLYDGTIDGVMKADLVDGVRHFQTLKGMSDSGTLTTGTLTALGIRAID